jgi:hypothetical protein
MNSVTSPIPETLPAKQIIPFQPKSGQDLIRKLIKFVQVGEMKNQTNKN